MARSSFIGAAVFLVTRFLLLLALASAARIAFIFSLRFYLRRRNGPLRRRILSGLGVPAGARQPRLVGLFHPYCNAGGGGERVLWAAVACLQREEPDIICLIYTGDKDATKADMVEKAKARFGIALDRDRMHLVYLRSRHLVEDSTWTRFTLLGQSLGSIVLGHEALVQVLPDVFIDTMGYAFTFPLVKLYAGIPVGAYVHYPTISTDMLQRVRDRTSGHTNASAVARSGLLSQAKLVYYVIFAWLYAWCLRKADYIMVNSSWTQAHVNHLLHDGQQGQTSAQPSILALRRKRAHIVYPPCDTKSLAVLPLHNREELILSVAQFRPEKEHATQLRAFKAYLNRPDASPRIKLILAGSVRNAGDSARVESLRSLATDALGIPSSRFEFVINPPFRDLVALFGRAGVGLSTMVDEHFGINVVEFMCAGLVPLVHASGGPLLDIVTEEDGLPTGYHAKGPEDYAEKLATILALSKEEQLKLRERARRKAVAQFSEANFDQGWMQAWAALERLRKQQ